MLKSAVNAHDFVVLAQRVANVGPVRFLRRFRGGARGRVETAWEHISSAPINWWDIPLVHQRWNLLMTGDERVDYPEYVSRRYFHNRASIRALSLGCGIGTKELRWAQACRISQLDAYDLSPSRIAAAASRAAAKGMTDRVHFAVGDVHRLQFAAASFDLIVLDGSLHHFSPVRSVLASAREWLTPDGILVVNDCVGPSRFQWTNTQIDLINALLAKIPPGYRARWKSDSVKKKVYRPGWLSMRISDPSEAADSSDIVPALREIFSIVEWKEYGGAVLQLLFKGIAHHYITPDPTATEILQGAFAAEDEAMKSGRVKSDFVFAVCRKQG